MKTTIDLPERILHRAKIAAAQRKTTLKELVVNGLEIVLQSPPAETATDGPLKRLQKGFHLSGKPLSRAKAHERKPLSRH